jgi:signal transduction histidine kinase
MDPAQAQQIVLNLVLNARDALPQGGQISVETRNEITQAHDRDPITTPGILLVVADNGRGMDAETQTHLFEPFFTTKAAGNGNGLGLTTVHSIVERNGGRIYLDSAPGKGTSVTVRLPRFSESEVPGTLVFAPAPDNALHLTHEPGGNTQKGTKESTP